LAVKGFLQLPVAGRVVDRQPQRGACRDRPVEAHLAVGDQLINLRKRSTGAPIVAIAGLAKEQQGAGILALILSEKTL
jgi:hypothetical protein